MKIKLIFILLFLNSCTAMPELFKTVDDVATDTAIRVEVDKEALQKDTDVEITVHVLNKDVKQP